MASSDGNTATFKMVSSYNAKKLQFIKCYFVSLHVSFNFPCVFQNSLDNDINQHFQDAIDVIQQHSNNSYYDSGKLLF